MKNFQKTFTVDSKRQLEIIDISGRVQEAVNQAGVNAGLCSVFSPHTTASIRINHNEPLLMQDLQNILHRLVPVHDSYAHDLFELRQTVQADERTNGHAHAKAFILGSSENIPIINGKLALGKNQSIFFVEFDGNRNREVLVQIFGE